MPHKEASVRSSGSDRIRETLDESKVMQKTRRQGRSGTRPQSRSQVHLRQTPAFQRHGAQNPLEVRGAAPTPKEYAHHRRVGQCEPALGRGGLRGMLPSADWPARVMPAAGQRCARRPQASSCLPQGRAPPRARLRGRPPPAGPMRCRRCRRRCSRCTS